MCGFWALWDLARCAAKGRAEDDDRRGWPVIGLMAGWGTVALHGHEGFRSEHATVLCLLSDSVWDPTLDLVAARYQRWLLRWKRWLMKRPTPGWEYSLRDAAEYHGVPLLPLADSVRRGVLAEFGMPRNQVESVSAALHLQ